MRKKHYFAFGSVILILVLFIITFVNMSHGYLEYVAKNESSSVVVAGKTECVNITLSDGGNTSLAYNYPINDSFAISNVKPVKIIVKNLCTDGGAIDYSLILTTLKDSNNYLSNEVIKIKVDKQINTDQKSTLINANILSTIRDLPSGGTKTLLEEKLNKTYSTYTKESKVIEKNKINPNTEIVYEIKMWIDYDTDNTSQGKNFKNVVSIVVNNPEENVIGGVLPNNLNYVRNAKGRGLSTKILGDMYRFVGAKDTVDNYICFGYNNATSECTSATSDYMYRIIGITEDGEMKLIKNNAIIEDSNNVWHLWKTDYSNNIKWPSTKAYTRLNGISNGSQRGLAGDTNLFIDSSTSNARIPSTSSWYTKINWHDWYYGDIGNNGTIDELNQSADAVFKIESGKVAGTSGFSKGKNLWTTINAKVGLLYIHDYYYSYSTNYANNVYANCQSSTAGCKNSWLHISNNGQTLSAYHEWTMSRFGFNENNEYAAIRITDDGRMNIPRLDGIYNIRPVFYLKNTANISSGNGTKEKPFIVEK